MSSLVCLGLFACTGDQGPPGDQGPKGDPGDPGTPAPTTGTLSGTIQDGVATTPLAGVQVTATAPGGGATLGTATTDAAGKFTFTLEAGAVALQFQKDFYTSFTAQALVFLGQTQDLTVVMNEAASGKPSLSLGAIANDPGYGATVTLTASATDPNGDPIVYTWTNTTAPALGKLTASGATATVELPTMAAAFTYRADPSNPGQFISGYTLEDRFGVVPILTDTRGQVTVSLTVSDGHGQTATASRTLNAASVHGGTKDVAVGQRVYVNSGHPGPSSWTLTAVPAGSTAALDDPTSRTPSFVADLEGAYTLTEAGSATPLTLYAKLWYGAIVGGSGDSVSVEGNCTLCHGASFPGAAKDMFTPWLGTGHATMFTKGINGKISDHYSGACFACHTVGFDDGISNHGFDDVAGSWAMPAMASTNWDSLVAAKPELARMANIQCESCHGPQGRINANGQLDIDEEAHTRTRIANGQERPFLSPRISYASENCATCHAAGAHHLYSEWNTLGEGNMGHASRVGMTRGVSTTGLNSSCGRCHVAQGYTLYADALNSGKIGLAALAAKDVDPADPLKDPLKQVTTANAEPVTCVACHDPHDATNPNQLRFYGNTPKLPSGFAGFGMGKGALCVTCHNSRNGAQLNDATLTLTYLHEDGELYNAGNPTGYSAPHQADQGDVFLGHNAYFLGASMPMTSKHAAIEDTCVGCHMTLQPKGYLSHGAPTPSGHLFRIEEADQQKLCANCHGSAVNGEGIQGQVEAQLAALAAKMGNAVKTKINAIGTAGGQVRVRAWDEASDLYSSTSASDLVVNVKDNPVTAVGIEEIHGQIGFVLTLTSDITITYVDSAGKPKLTVTGKTFGVQMGALMDNPAPPATPAALYKYTATDAANNPIPCTTCRMVRAGWNYFLVEGDQSKGLHNPSFVNAVLNATLAQDLSN
ncbi:MAG TPA: carboxypeptidase regulatory-like domain-containing protein [Kofleriaceae bacterium]|nr:carboxypeptidase regulatory-like domain-containing protein [Kofleriaceae bacterium]